MNSAQHELRALYVAPEEARKKLLERKASVPTKPTNALEVKLHERHYAVLFRQIATANFETLRFVSLAKASGLSPLVIEYHDDRFAERNPAKHAWLRMRFPCEAGRNGGSNAKIVTLTDVTKANGLRLCQLQTQWGRNVIEFHHQLVRTVSNLRELEWHDGSDWFRLNGGSARSYYPSLFDVFIRQAVLFESFPEQGCDAEFTSRVMIPALAEISRKREMVPLICRLDPIESEGDPTWLHYPQSLFHHALRLAGYKSRSEQVKWVRRLGLAPHLRLLPLVQELPAA